MNVYDFDKTIYNGDRTVDFYLYAVKRKPSILRFLPIQIKGFFLYFFRRICKTALKEYFFCFLPDLASENILGDFWKENEKKVFAWYLIQKKADDLVISASPDFLLRPICEKIGIQNLIASELDQKTGKYQGLNCRGEEKVRRFLETYGNTAVDEFYSDSVSDLPMARLAQKAYMVRNGVIADWDTGNQ